MAMRNIEEKLQALGATPPDRRKAHFVSALAVAWPDGETRLYEGRVDGTLVWPPRGTNGFGYDPLFVVNGLGKTAAELDPEHKNRISHRGLALQKLLAQLNESGRR